MCPSRALRDTTHNRVCVSDSKRNQCRVTHVLAMHPFSLLYAASVHHRQHLDFDQTIRMSQATYFHGRTRRERAEILHPHVDMAEELVDVRDIGGRLHNIVQGRTGGGERRGDILTDLPELGAHVPLADHVTLSVT